MRGAPDFDRRRGPMLFLGDCLAVVAFAALGLASHGESLTWDGMFRNVWGILAAWFLLSPLLRTYTRPGWRTLLSTWAVAVPAGVAIRALSLGHPTGSRFVTFLLVTMAVTLALLALWRLAEERMRRRRSVPAT